MNAVMTDRNGKHRMREDDVQMSRPPLVTDFAPCLTDVLTIRKAKRQSTRWAKTHFRANRPGLPSPTP